MLIKASAGGGGRGDASRPERSGTKGRHPAGAGRGRGPLFGNADIYLEKYVEHPRHVEVQVIADNHGHAIHLFERDCTMQRRHQKLVEESPAPRLEEQTRIEMCEAAVRLIRAANYTNAGTVEFIVDPTGNFYFIELNARIQVEHTVTEMVTGIDLIKAQLHVAAGEPLPFTQDDVQLRGATIECRINAEDPEKNFRPTPGTITRLRVPRRVRRPFRFARPRGLRRFALLRFDDRQAARPPAHPRRGHRLHETGAGRAAHRGRENDHPLAPENPRPHRLQRSAG